LIKCTISEFFIQLHFPAYITDLILGLPQSLQLWSIQGELEALTLALFKILPVLDLKNKKNILPGNL